MPAPATVRRTARPARRSPYTPDGTTGYQSLDLQITKNFEIGDLGSMYLRLDVLNVTNEDNLVDYIDITRSRRNHQRRRYTPYGNITGVPRTVRMSFGVKF